MLVHVPVDERGFAARRHPCRLPRINQLISGGPSSHDIVYRAAAPLLQSHHITHSENTMNPTTMKPATVTIHGDSGARAHRDADIGGTECRGEMCIRDSR